VQVPMTAYGILDMVRIWTQGTNQNKIRPHLIPAANGKNAHPGVSPLNRKPLTLNEPYRSCVNDRIHRSSVSFGFRSPSFLLSQPTLSPLQVFVCLGGFLNQILISKVSSVGSAAFYASETSHRWKSRMPG
jgi:hypothetical protein